MCNKHSSATGLIRGHEVRLDPCIKDKVVQMNTDGIVTCGSCCGHGIQPRTILIKLNGRIIDFDSGKVIPRTRNLYRYDEKGYPYVPEVRDA